MFLPVEYYYCLVESHCPTGQMFFISNHLQKLPEHPIQYFKTSQCSRFLIKVGANTQAELELFLEDELEGHVPLISPGDVKAPDVFGLRDRQLLVSMSFDAVPVRVPAMHW